MIIINKKTAKKLVKAWSGVGFRKFPISDKAEHVDAQGFEKEEDVEEEKARKKFLKTHPFRRRERFSEDVPGIIRWLWNPRTGELISSAGRSTEHALMLSNYKMRSKKKDAGPYNEWIRGFYFPRTHELAIRPYDMEVFKPVSQVALRTTADEELFYEMARKESAGIRERIAAILEKQLGKFKKVHFDVGDQYLRDHFQGVGGERW